MTELDWHADRTDLSNLVLLDRAPESEGSDLKAGRLYRLQRVREEMEKRAIDALILSCPVNIRYTTGTRNMQVFSARNSPTRYLLVTPDRTILYEFAGCHHLAEGYETIDEVRPALTASFAAAGDGVASRERTWATEMWDTIRHAVGQDAVVGMERMNAGASIAMAEFCPRIVDAQEPVEIARSVKSDEEMKCVRASLRATEVAVGRLRDAIRPGMTENELWSVLHQSVIAQNGDYCETRLISSGERTNPWFREAANKVILENELIALDTDVVGCHGYYSDFSRTFHAGPDLPTETQRTLYKTAHEQVQHNVGILHAGMTFREYAEKAWEIPPKYLANRYFVSSHGVGMTGEYPYLYHREDFPSAGYDGVLMPGMTICVESFTGEEGGQEGVKLEEQVLITEEGTEVLSQFPFEEALLN